MTDMTNIYIMIAEHDDDIQLEPIWGRYYDRQHKPSQSSIKEGLADLKDP